METIAIVDDDDEVAGLLKEFLESKGFKVWRTLDANQFMALVKGNAPDLVIMDLQMPGVSGVTAAKSLRSDPATKGIPIVVLSAMPRDLQTKWFFGMGEGIGFVEKPVDFPELMRTIEGLLRG
ncbi:MAG: response regulator [Elusimicrobiota bacterium]